MSGYTDWTIMNALITFNKESKMNDQIETELPVETNNFNFGEAIRCLKGGMRVSRRGWHGQDMFIVLMPELNLPPYNAQDIGPKVNDRTAKWIGEDTPLNCQAYIAMYIPASNKWVPGWLASQLDILAEDWFLVA